MKNGNIKVEATVEMQQKDLKRLANRNFLWHYYVKRFWRRRKDIEIF